MKAQSGFSEQEKDAAIVAALNESTKWANDNYPVIDKGDDQQVAVYVAATRAYFWARMRPFIDNGDITVGQHGDLAGIDDVFFVLHEDMKALQEALDGKPWPDGNGSTAYAYDAYGDRM